MSELNQLIQQRDQLERQIHEIKKRESAEVLAKVRELVKAHGFTEKEVFGKVGQGVKVIAKYRDPQSGQTWTGRGKVPKWLEGKDKTAFLITA